MNENDKAPNTLFQIFNDDMKAFEEAFSYGKFWMCYDPRPEKATNGVYIANYVRLRKRKGRFVVAWGETMHLREDSSGNKHVIGDVLFQTHGSQDLSNAGVSKRKRFIKEDWFEYLTNLIVGNGTDKERYQAVRRMKTWGKEKAPIIKKYK